MEKELTFLVIVDESPEMYKALRYAALRSLRNDGRVALLYTFDKLEFSHWKAVEDIAEVESREKAELQIKDIESFLSKFTSKKPKKFIMKGDRIECITNFLKENKFISNLVLASTSEKSGHFQSLFHTYTYDNSGRLFSLCSGAQWCTMVPMAGFGVA